MKIESNVGVLEIEKADFETLKATDVAVQCTLQIPKEKLSPVFTITDAKSRRSFVRKLYGLIILQNFISLFAMEMFLHTTLKAVSGYVFNIISIVVLLVFLLMYFIRHQRRKEPLNYLFFAMATALYISQEVLYSKMVNTELVVIQQCSVISQLTFLILYSKLYFIRFTNCRGVIVIFINCSLYLVCIFFWSPMMIVSLLLRSFLSGCYIIYDTQLMLNGQHGYELEADEYIFAATNIYADWAIILWRIFKFVFFDHLIVIVKFFMKCCKAEVC